MLRYNLKRMFKLRNIEKPHRFLIEIGISRSVTYKLLSDDLYVLKLDHIEKMCKSLKCTPNDLLLYIPNQPVNPAYPQPIEQLIRKTEEFDNVPKLLNSLNIDQLREVGKIIFDYTENQNKKLIDDNQKSNESEVNEG